MANDTKVKDRWYVTTDFFRCGGKIVQSRDGHRFGPWDTRDEALACRFGLEHGTGQDGRYAVDNQANPA